MANENDEVHSSVNSLPVISESREDGEYTKEDEDMDISPPSSQAREDLTEALIEDKVSSLISEMNAKNEFTFTEQRIKRGIRKEDVSFSNNQEIKSTALSGVKRPRTIVNKQQGSVHVSYKSLTRESKQKLEELLQQWSQYDASLNESSNEVLESGEETYFPALHISGANKSLAVSFWIDNQTNNSPNKEFIPLDGTNVPLYDRGFSLSLASTNMERGVEVIDTSRCFNCGSYNHSLKECPKPRDSTAVNNARKQLKSKRNQNPSSRTPIRYYQTTPKGKFDGLKPGVLDSETRRLLGLSELDPPPWLNRMREIGYPPGYLDNEDEEKPSGIIIFADEKEETEEGEIFGGSLIEMGPPGKMSVEFPGINGPIPENADKRRWEVSNMSRNQSPHSYGHRRYERYNETREGQYGHLERGGSREYYNQDEDEVGPPGTSTSSTSSWSSYALRYGVGSSSNNNHGQSGNLSGRRSFSERSRRSSHEDSNRGVYGSY